MSARTPLTATLLFPFIALAPAACDRAEVQRTAASAEKKTERALDKTQEKLAQAGDRLAEAGAKTLDTVKDAVKIEREGVSATGGPGKPVTTTVKTGPQSSVSGLPEKTREALEDTAITTAIKAGFVKEPGLSVLKIDVDTNDGVVTLNGVADTEDAKRRAGELAKGTSGVKQVRNHLTVKQG